MTIGALEATLSTDPQPFDVCGELPKGMALLQASAGTGKTFTIAALTTRYVAEGMPIDRLLVITFTRMATGELRERVRDRLVSAFHGLDQFVGGSGLPADDELVRVLADTSPAEVAVRRDRLARAIADFDSATIETTHGFCLQVLYGLGTAGDVDREVTLVEDVRDLIEEVVDDLYLRRFAHRPNPLEFSREEALDIAMRVLSQPDARIVPELSAAEDLSSIRRRFAKAVREEIDRRKRALKILTYDDVLIRLRDTLIEPQRGPAACARLRERYEVVLVDEFQDTDPVQWEIMHRAFGLGGSTLVLIGDPKQAIYAFRGADVHAYLDARETVQSEWTLDVNWRSDEGLLAAYDALFAKAQLGEAGITYRNIRAADANREPRLVGTPTSAPLRARIVHADDGLVTLTSKKRQPQTEAARDFVARDLAAEVVALLAARPEVITRRRDGSELGRVLLHPGHIAVLVRFNSHARIVQNALTRVGVKAVIGGSGSVFGTEPARDWLRLLEALERPTARDRASLAALTCFVGWTPELVATAGEAQWEDLHWSLHQWAALLRDRGVASLYEKVSSTHQVPARVLAGPSGERFMTDLRHVAQLLHEAGVSEGLGPTAMASWLGRRINEAERDTENEERARRLESDHEAVQVITIHRSKGLEFPIVLCPYMWSSYTPTIKVPVFHDKDNGKARTIDVAGEGNGFTLHQQDQLVEERGEDLRLLYVALTRARHQAVLWWVGANDCQHSPLSRLIFDRDADGVVDSHGSGARTDLAVADAFTALGPQVLVERVAAPPDVHWEEEEVGTPTLEAASFDRTLDLGWRRVSYSGITSALHEQPTIGSEPEQQLTSDEEVPAITTQRRAEVGPDEKRLRTVALGLSSMPGGTLVGTLVHSVLERTEFDAPDLPKDVRAALQREVTWRNVDLGSVDAVVSGLCTAIESPLGPLAGDVRLRDLPRLDRLDEMGFEIPLVGGEVPTTSLHVAQMADLLEAHLDPADPVARYAQRLRDPALHGIFRGYLTGSLDLVFRRDNRFFIADYKTNRLSVSDETLTAWHYRPDALHDEMMAAHYPLQALLYAVALHRYLRWRLAGYDPEHHLGGVLYLFVRGMSAIEPTRIGDQPCGVWSWRPPGHLVESLSELFDSGVAP